MEHIPFQETIKGLEIDQIIRDQEYSMTTRHFHDTYELYFLLEGRRYYFIDKETYLAEPGDVVLIQPNQIHKTSTTGDSYHNRILLQIKSPVFDPAFVQNGFLPLKELYARQGEIIHLSREDRLRTEQLLLQLKDEIHRKQKHHQSMVTIKLMELFILLSRYQRSAVFYQENQKVQTVKHQKVHEVADYLTAHPEEDSSLEQLSARFFISKSYLTRIFKEVTGFTVTEYRNITRIKKAQQLLTHGDYSVTELSELLGFESMTYFERVFKKHTGLSPLQYRKQ